MNNKEKFNFRKYGDFHRNNKNIFYHFVLFLFKKIINHILN